MEANALEVARILTAAEALLQSAIKSADTDPVGTIRQIQSAIGTMQSVRGFLL